MRFEATPEDHVGVDYVRLRYVGLDHEFRLLGMYLGESGLRKLDYVRYI